MTGKRVGLTGCVVLLAGSAVWAMEASTSDPSSAPADAPLTTPLVQRIDQHIAAAWSSRNIEPLPLADDAEYMRRVYLDVIGRIPSVAEAREFLDDTSADKRAQLVERLLDSPRYAVHWANVWRALLLPEASTSVQARTLQPGFESWLGGHLEKNTPYDAIVRELLTVPVKRDDAAANIYDFSDGRGNPLAYYLAKEATPENLAAGTARVFLGIRLECAQCHNHPFADWKQEQFWGYAAFFAGIKKAGAGDFTQSAGEIADRRELNIPGTDRVAPASFPDGTRPARRYRTNSRQVLADWTTSPDNPYFARATVNRLWYHFFGQGIVEPVDDMVGGESTCTQPELLSELAREFAGSKFDLKQLIRAIAASRAYQTTSAAASSGEQAPLDSFARIPVRGLTPEQLFDSFAQATGADAIVGREQFMARFGAQSDRPTEHQTSIIQALAMMNGQAVAGQTSIERSATLAAAVDAPFLTTPQRIETLYLAALSRRPTADEQTRLVQYVEKAGAGPPAAAALSDIFWALLNSSEFVLNH